MEKHISISNEEYNDILQWLKEEIGLNGTGLNELSNKKITEEKIVIMKDTFSFQRWQVRKAYYEFATVMRKTRLGSILISVIEKIDKIFEKIFC